MGDDDEMPRTAARAHVLVIPYPAQPHILPMLHLVRQIVSRGDVTVTFVSFQTLIDRLVGKEETRSGTGSGALINFVGVRDDDPGHDFPSELPYDPIVLRESLLLGYNMEPFVDKLLRDRQSAGVQVPTCMLVDYQNWWTIDIAARLNVPRYVLCVVAAPHVANILSWHEHEVETLPGGGIRLAGVPPNIVTEYRHFTLLRSEIGKQILTRWPKSVTESDGVLLNTWTALASQTIDSIRNMVPKRIPLLAVGPLGALSSADSKSVSLEGLALSGDEEVMNWLNQQPPSSVLYVSFGTTGMFNLARKHVVELATGLERSQQRFVWVLRAPRDVPDINDALPRGFKERTKSRGLLLEGWAPQRLILSHPSTGGFLSSCGWNSATESISRGVPIIGWPSFADQPEVCRTMALISKVAIELPQQEDFFVKADDIASAINIVLGTAEGTEMRKRAAECKAAVSHALAPGGSSFRSVDAFYELIMNGPAKSSDRNMHFSSKNLGTSM